MIGLVYLFAFAVYLAISYFVVRAVMRWARKTGRSTKKWGWGAAIAMYLLVFWDFLPTLVLHKGLCATRPEVRIYKTAEQWNVEHGTEPAPTALQPGKHFSKDINGASVVLLNSRFGDRIQTDTYWPISTRVNREQIFDIVDNRVVIERISVHSGYGDIGNTSDWRAMKVWLAIDACTPPAPDFYREMEQFRMLAKEDK